jgi:hypothetical protein
MSELLLFDEAVALYELGMHEPNPCFGCYHTGNKPFLSIANLYEINGFSEEDMIPAPTYGQAFKWFRDKHGLYAEIELDQTMEPKFCFSINWYKETDLTVEWINMTDRPEFFLEYSYEKAELSCLRRLIEIVKQRKK